MRAVFGTSQAMAINLRSLLKSVGKHCSNCPNRRERTWARATLSGAASSEGGERTVHLIDIFDYVAVFVLKYIFFCIESTVIERLDKTSCQIEHHS